MIKTILKKYFYTIITPFFFLYLAVVLAISVNAGIPIGGCLFPFPDGRVHYIVIEDSFALAREGKFKKAAALIKPLACNGDIEAQHLLSQYYNDPDALNQPEAGERLLYQLAEKDYAPAQYDLGWLLVIGWRDAPIEDLVKMIYWFEKAAFNGEVTAYANLAVLYDNEPRNILLEMEEAARNGNTMAQFNMGWIYARGLLTTEGLMQDLDIAENWFIKSASLGFQDSIDILENNFRATGV